MSEFLKAAKSPFVWRFICHTFTYLLEPLEFLRRWGLVCPCHREERRAGRKQIKCDFNSRRLREVPEKVASVATSLRWRSANLTSGDLEGDTELHLGLVNSMRYAASESETRTKYCSNLPWAYARCNTKENAIDVIQQYESVPSSTHDVLTVETWQEFEADIRHLARTGELSDGWKEECDNFNLASLDESPGEGYHRSTHHLKVRGPGLLEVGVVAGVRQKENLKLVRKFMRTYKHDGRQIVRFEWRNWKRILQRRYRRFTPVRMQTKRFFERLYRMDAMACTDWTPYISKPGSVIVPAAQAETSVDGMAREFLTRVFAPLQYYSFPERKEVLAPDGSLVTQERETIFQVVKIHKGRSRTHVIPSFRSVVDKSVVSRLALHIQHFTLWDNTSSIGDDGRAVTHAYSNGDPVWLDPDQLANFATLRKDLVVYKKVEPSANFGQCQALSDAHQAKPQYKSLRDRDCPTLLVLAGLKQLGWKQSAANRPMIHDDATLKVCDSRGGVSSKPYYQCLLDIRQSLLLTSRLPSNAYQNYYQCILAGKRAESSQTDLELRSILKDTPAELLPLVDDNADVESLFALESADAPALAHAAVGDGIIGGVVLQPIQPKAEAQPKPVPKPKQVGFLPMDDEAPAPVVAKAKPKPSSSALAVAAGASISSSSSVAPIVAKAPPPLPPLPPPAGLPPPAEDGIIAGAAVVLQGGPKRNRNWQGCIAGPGDIYCDSYRPLVGKGYVNWILRVRFNGKTLENMDFNGSLRGSGPDRHQVGFLIHVFVFLDVYVAPLYIAGEEAICI
jgi:hypothetical protein